MVATVRPCALALLLTVIPSALSAAEAQPQHHPSEFIDRTQE
jgi:hypothetical protein